MPKTVDDLLGELGKKELRIGRFSKLVKKVQGYTTGNLAIDYVTGVGGLPRGRITELAGLNSSGKTTTALQSAVHLQRSIIANKSDDRILYLDFEHALDGEYAEALGLDLEHPSLILAQPHWLEQGAEAALQLINTGKIRMSIWDSVAAMAPKRLIEGGFDQATNAMHRAKLMSGLMQTLASLLDEKDCAGVFINHLMEAVEMSGRPGLPPRTTTPGGRALKYYSSLRLEYKQGAGIRSKFEDFLTGEDANQQVAQQVHVKCIKNKVGAPFRTAEVRSRFGMGFDNSWSALQVLCSRDLVRRASAGRFYFDAKYVPGLVHADMKISDTGRPTIHGENNVLLFAENHPDWRQALIARAEQAITEGAEPGSSASEEVEDD